MNMISELRQRVRQNGKADITPEEFDRLQAEWITRTGADDMVLAEREACADLCERLWPSENRSGHEWSDGFADGTCDCADAIRARSNAEVMDAVGATSTVVLCVATQQLAKIWR